MDGCMMRGAIRTEPSTNTERYTLPDDTRNAQTTCSSIPIHLTCAILTERISSKRSSLVPSLPKLKRRTCNTSLPDATPNEPSGERDIDDSGREEEDRWDWEEDDVGVVVGGAV